MQYLILIVVFLAGILIVDAAVAQQQSDPVFMQKVLTTVATQRDEANNRLAVEAARGAMLSEENAKLKAEVDKLKAPKADDAK